MKTVLFGIYSMLITPAITFASFLFKFLSGRNIWSAISPYGSFGENSLFFIFLWIMSPSEIIKIQKGYFLILEDCQRSGQPVLLSVGKIDDIIDVTDSRLSSRPMKADREIPMRSPHNYGSLFLPLLI